MRKTSQLLLAAAAISIAGSSALAQAAAPQPAEPTTRSYVQVYRLHPDMVNEWIDLQRNEVIPAQKKGGLASRTTLVTQVGNSFEYVVITPFPKWAAMDGQNSMTQALGAEGAARLNAKLRKAIQTQTSYMTNVQNELAIPGGDAMVWRTVVRRALPGKMADYLAYYKTEVMPALQKAKADGKIAGASVAVRGAGANSGEFTTITLYAKFADIDAGDPLVLVLGADAAAKVNAKAALFATTNQTIIRRRLADLSF